jgi:ABC-type uncharacterized transport system YnjBCD permease subunit
MTATDSYPTQLEFEAGYRLARWRPLVQWLLAIPHLAIAWALTQLRNVLTVISLFTVLFTKRIPRTIFDAIAMTYRYEWRAVSYALFLHEDYPPFDFTVGAEDDRAEPHTTLTIGYPTELNRWKPLYKWLLAIPHYVVLAVLFVAACFSFLGGLVAVVVTGEYPHGIRDFLVDVYRYGLRVQTYVGLLTDSYPPFRLHA